MIERRIVAALAAVLLAACGENPDATTHIRAVLGGEDAPAADTARTATRAGPEEGRPAVTLPTGDTLLVRSSVAEFYRARGYRPAWTDDDEILPRGEGLLEAIGGADSEGLDRERYNYSTARELASLLADDAVEDRELEYLGSLDILLTESFARLSSDLVAGTLDPDAAGLNWRIPRGSAPDRDLIEQVVEGDDPRAILASLRPGVPYYHRLIDALNRLREIEEQGGWPTVPDGEALEPGSSGPRVAALRGRLLAEDDPTETRLARRGQDSMQEYDDSLAAAVRHFQARHALDTTAVVGPATRAALNVSVEDRLEALRLNLDRWRWLPNELGERFLLVNIAGFELEVVVGDSAIESMNVVVGETANRTPVFADTLEYLVVNPYWNVPESIALEEIVPAALADTGYLARNHYEVVRDGAPISVDPASLDTLPLYDGDLRIRQRPGPWNALGHVKFLFPNPYDIYLHDTPADHLFTQRSRAFSHGCIRVERPDDLARTLLERLTDLDASDLAELRQSSEEEWVEVEQEIPVYILYFTTWVEPDGTIRFHRDIYARDKSLEAEREEKLGPREPPAEPDPGG